MAFLSGMMLFDCPASALNNAGPAEGARVENAIAVKFIKTRQGAFPYVSAQAFRYWLRTILENSQEIEWQAAPVFREQKIAYSDANPIRYWDDDIFGYMRASSKRAEAAEKRKEDKSREKETPTSTEITRVSPFRVSTLVSISPVTITEDFGTMSRQEGDPVLYEHQFYKTILKGMISLDLKSAGTFSYRNRTGFRNLDDNRIAEAKGLKLEELNNDKSFRLSIGERKKRISSLLHGMGILYGGAKQALHYTDVSPKVFIGMITRGGNNPLQYIIVADDRGLPSVHIEAIKEMRRVWQDQMLSKLYVGWVQGFHDEQRESFKKILDEIKSPYTLDHPREILKQLSADISHDDNDSWLA